MIAMLSRSSAAHRARSQARAKIAHAVAASRARLRRLYHVEWLTPSVKFKQNPSVAEVRDRTRFQVF
jgi:hypothetical protein